MSRTLPRPVLAQIATQTRLRLETSFSTYFDDFDFNEPFDDYGLHYGFAGNHALLFSTTTVWIKVSLDTPNT